MCGYASGSAAIYGLKNVIVFLYAFRQNCLEIIITIYYKYNCEKSFDILIIVLCK